jgi:hypothetical protein
MVNPPDEIVRRETWEPAARLQARILLPERNIPAIRGLLCPGRDAAFFTPLRRSGTHPRGWTPDQQRTTP